MLLGMDIREERFDSQPSDLESDPLLLCHTPLLHGPAQMVGNHAKQSCHVSSAG